MKHGQKVRSSMTGETYFFIGYSVTYPEKHVVLQKPDGNVMTTRTEYISPHFEFGDKVLYKHRHCLFLRFSSKDKGCACIIPKGEVAYITVPIKELEEDN